MGPRPWTSCDPAGPSTPRHCAYGTHAGRGRACGRRRPPPLFHRAPPAAARHPPPAATAQRATCGPAGPAAAPTSSPATLSARLADGHRRARATPAAVVASARCGRRLPHERSVPRGARRLACIRCRGVSPRVLSLPEAQLASTGRGALATARKASAPAVAVLRGQVRHLVSPPHATGRCRRRSMRKVRPAAGRPPPSSPATISAGLALQHAQAPTSPRAAAARTRLQPEAQCCRHRRKGLVKASASRRSGGPTLQRRPNVAPQRC